MRTFTSVLLLLAAIQCQPEASGLHPAAPKHIRVPTWPHPQAPLTLLALNNPPTQKRKPRVYLDAGHGALGNQGALLVHCEHEETYTLRVTQALLERLAQHNRFELRISRLGSQAISYKDRLRDAYAWRADIILSLHADARGLARWAETDPLGTPCYANDAEPGFAILWSDVARTAILKTSRGNLARQIASHMQSAGFLAYDGVDYTGLYEADATPGVFVDRHVPGQRIFFLKDPTIPSVIIETHHGLYEDEHTLWQQPRTLDAFASAVAAALVSYFDREAAYATTEPKNKDDPTP